MSEAQAPLEEGAQFRQWKVRTKRKGWLTPHPRLRGKSHTQDDRLPLSCQVSPWPTDTELWFLPGQVQVGVDAVFSRDPEEVSLQRKGGQAQYRVHGLISGAQCPPTPNITFPLSQEPLD